MQVQYLPVMTTFNKIFISEGVRSTTYSVRPTTVRLHSACRVGKDISTYATCSKLDIADIRGLASSNLQLRSATFSLAATACTSSNQKRVNNLQIAFFARCVAKEPEEQPRNSHHLPKISDQSEVE